jgi:hypothetical protein
MNKSRPVVIVMSVLAGLQFLFAGMTAANLGDLANKTVLTVGAFGMLATAAAQVAMQFYVQNQVTPTQDVVAYRNREGDIVPGQLAVDQDKAAAAVEVLSTPPAGDPVA